MQYNTTPLPRILNAKDPITGLKLVERHRSGWRPNPHIPVCRPGEEHLVENYESAKNDNFRGWVCHHRLEFTLDGEFANSSIDLVNKDMYFRRPYYELVWMKRGEHTTLHHKGRITPDSVKMKMSNTRRDKRVGPDNPMWKGDNVSDKEKRRRVRRAKMRAIRKLASSL